MSSYLGKHAQYYDIFYQDKDYAAEAAFVDECLKRYGSSDGRKLLELACGTGNHAFALEGLGYQLIASDYSEDLLAEAKKKAKVKDSEIDFRLADMRTLDVDERPFDALICLFDSIGYVQSDEAIKKVLQNVHKHLIPGGLFVFEFWHADAMLRHYDPVRIRRWPLPKGELLRISSTKLEKEKSLASVSYEIIELHNDNKYEMINETQVNRFFTVAEMDEFLRGNHFEPLTWLNGYAWDETISEESWHILGVARAA